MKLVYKYAIKEKKFIVDLISKLRSTANLLDKIYFNDLPRWVPKIGERVRYYGIKGFREADVRIMKVTRVNGLTGTYQLNNDIYAHPKQIRKLKKRKI